MNRLLHRDLKAWVRSLQMSEHSLFIVVEGRDSDRYFYGKLAKQVCAARSISYWTILPGEIPIDGTAGRWSGKPALVRAHALLQEASYNCSILSEKKTVIVFLADKDIDNLARGGRLVKSQHFVYTKFYDVEAHIFAGGDVIGAAAACASADEQQLAVAIRSPDGWLRHCAELWKDWIKICVFCERYEAPGIANYHYESKINAPSHGALDVSKHREYMELLRAAARLNEEKFNQAYAIISRLVDRLYDEGRFLELFRGKWFVNFMEHTLTEKGILFDKKRLHAGLLGTLSHSLDPSQPWAVHFTSRIEAALDS